MTDRRLSIHFFSGVAWTLLVVATFASTARADDAIADEARPEQTASLRVQDDIVRMSRRPAVLPQGTASASTAIGWESEFEPSTTWTMGIELAATDWLAAYVSPATVRVDEAEFGTTQLGLRARYPIGKMELVGEARVAINGDGVVMLTPSTTFVLHHSTMFRLDAGLAPTFTFDGGRGIMALANLATPSRLMPGLPLSFWFSPASSFSFCIWTGLGATNVEAFESTGYVGLGSTWVATIEHEGKPLIDLRVDTGHPRLHHFDSPWPLFTVFEITGGVASHVDLF
ncbi:MAG: hypothetical protein HOW73_35535 [Polyangiaceae bacterium]|nr:hypothetical protein [Polyangiaceae bacterium]